MDARQAKMREMCSNPIAAPPDNPYAPHSAQGFDPFRPHSAKPYQRSSNTFYSEAIPSGGLVSGDPRQPTEGSINARAQAIAPPDRAHAVTYERIKDRGTVSNVVFEMDGQKWSEQAPERSKLKRVSECPKDHGAGDFFGEDNVQLRPDRYLQYKPEFTPKYDQEDPRVRAYQHLHGAQISKQELKARQDSDVLPADNSWVNYPTKDARIPKQDVPAAHLRKQQELAAGGFGQQAQEGIPKAERSLWGSTMGWADSNSNIKRRPQDAHADAKGAKYSQLSSSVFDVPERPRTAQISLMRENETINNLNSEKRRANHNFSDINGRELGVRAPGEQHAKHGHGDHFTTNSDWRSSNCEIQRRKTAEYSQPVAKNTSSAMSQILPLPAYNAQAVDSKSHGAVARKHDSEANDIHLGEDYTETTPKVVKQLQLKSNLHRADFYKDEAPEHHQVYELQINKLPASTFDADLAKLVQGQHVVKCEVDYDKIMGSCSGKGRLLLRSSPSKLAQTKQNLEAQGLQVSETQRKEVGKKSNFAQLNQVDWMHPQLQKEERRLQNPDLRTHDYMLAHDLYKSSGDIFGNEMGGKYVDEWKKKLLESRATKNQTKAEDSKVRETMQTWNAVKKNVPSFRDAYNANLRSANVRTTVKTIRLK